MSRILIISSDCHAGALPGVYNEYMPSKYHAEADAWWIRYAREMVLRRGTFFDQEASEAYDEQSSGESGKFVAERYTREQLTDEKMRAMLNDGASSFAPRKGEWDPSTRLQELEADGVVGEVIFPQMVPFGASLLQYRHEIAELNRVGNRAYNAWLADLCNANKGRHAGVAVISVDDIDEAVEDVREARELGLFGGVLLPGSTGEHPYYHHPRYEPLWDVCEELDMPLQSHSSWSPDYGDVECATAMYITEVDGYAHRPFPALLWSGALERHPDLKLVFTEAGCTWIFETLRCLEFKSANPIFKHFTRDLSLSPTEYFERHVYFGASFFADHESGDRHRLGLDKIMYGTDYPHLEGTWPNSLEEMRRVLGEFPEGEIRAILGENAAAVYGFDVDSLRGIVEKVGPSLSDIQTTGRAVS